MRDETKTLRLIDWVFYLIFIPAILLLIPTDRMMERDPYFFALMMVYIMVIHIINRRFNFVTYMLQRKYHRATAAICAVAVVTYITTLVKVDDIRDMSFGVMFDFRHAKIRIFRLRTLFTLLFIDLCFTVMLALLVELFRQKFEKQGIEAARVKAEAAIYKSQINPHFMFNTLNTIYALNLTGSDKTSEVIMKFSNIVKYMYQNSDKEKIMISEEVKYLREFIDLHTLRLSDQTKVNFTSEIDDESEYIPSMIFITFVENIFKYGVSSEEESAVDISLCLKNGLLTFATSNTIFMRGADSSGIELENCRKRLSLLYPDRYVLVCVEEGDQYKIDLKIEL